MAKTISVDELTYSNVVSTAGKIMMHTGKTVSLGYTIYLGIQALEKRLSSMSQKEIEALKEALKDITSPAQIDEAFDKWFMTLTGKEPQQRASESGKPSDKSSTAYIQ